jgi:hypothetical protein
VFYVVCQHPAPLKQVQNTLLSSFTYLTPTKLYVV